MVKKAKNPKHIDRDEQKTPAMAGKPETGGRKTNVSDAFLDELKGAFNKFEKIPELKRIELYGKQEYLEQFREHFKKEYPNLLDKIDKEDLPAYIQELEKKGFSISNIKENASKLHTEFQADDTEEHVMHQSLSQLQKFCEDTNNNLPSGAFKKFSETAGFDADPIKLRPDGKLKTLDALYGVRKDFLKKEDIHLGETIAQHAEQILTPNYNPTERIMVTVAITKMKKELKGTLKTAFDAQFPLPINIFSPYQDLLSFKNILKDFLDDHASEIDESLAKKLDSVIVTNGDIQREFINSGKKFDDTKGFSEREKYFSRVFNKLVTRQLFEEVKETQKSVDHYLEAMGNTFKEFPPYVNEILNMYPFNDKNIVAVDASFHADLQIIDDQVLSLQEQYAAATDAERKEFRKKIRELKQQREHRRRQAYITFLRTKNPPIADIFDKLVASKFDFTVLSAGQQQELINSLVKHKLQDTIKNKVPELLDVTEEELTQFITDLFDLKKMDIVIPTRTGPVPLTFIKKEFLATDRKELPALTDLENLQNLPLNFVTQFTDTNAAFFEDSASIFDSIYTDFNAKNGKVRFNDAYKVRIKKNGKTVDGYLSSYSPIAEKNIVDRDGKELYLYSEPITSPSQERELVTRPPHEEGKTGIPVVIKDTEQEECDVEILDRKINLNGEALGALLFGYVVGQHSMAQELTSKEENELAKKFGKLNVYKEKAEEEDEEQSEPVIEAPENKIESSEKDKFFNERKQLKGYSFPEEKYNVQGKENFGFVEGTRLFIPFADSEVPPLQNGGKARLQMEIIHIDTAKGTFKVKIHGGELRLGKSEGATKELPINAESILGIKKAFGNNIYKLPDPKNKSFADQMSVLTSSKVTDGFEDSFGKIKYDGGKFKFVLGDETGQDVEYFGWYDPKIGENPDEERGSSVLYKIKHNVNGTFTVSGEITNDQERIKYPSRDMDYSTFLLFIKEKKLQPKTQKQAEALKKQQDLKNQETPTTVHGFSINNVLGFFKNSFTKLKDSIKKYDEERTEDLTDLLTSQGELYASIGKMFGPFARVGSSFETMGAEYFLERDNRIRKKVEKRQKFYEDQHFPTIYKMYLDPLLKGKIQIKPHYKIAALLLTMIKKGPGPYRSNPEMVGKGTWINILMGPEHQARYLAMRDKKIRELEQNGSTYPGVWTDQVKNELVELEMKYIVHVIDGRQLGLSAPPPNGDGGATEKYLCGKYSRKFAGELNTAYGDFYKQETVDASYNKIPKTTNFEFARFEYFRLINERPQSAIPYLKVMAEKAITEAQWKSFEHAVLSGILSGVFLNMTFSDTAGFIQKVCRTRGFLPGLRVRDYNQQTKVARLLDIISDNDFFKTTGYKFTDFKFGNMPNAGGIGGFIGKFKNRLDKDPNLVSKFLDLTGKAKNGQTLVEMYANPKTSPEDKMLLGDLINKSLEKDEEIDTNVKYNPGALKGSVFTKNQSLIDGVIKYADGQFSGKDKDEIQSIQSFWKEVGNSIPKGKESDAQVEYFLRKFINRFEDKGFSDNDRTIFIRRLKTASDEIKKGNTKQAEDILRYTIVGTIVKNSGRGGVPPELRSGLEGFKDFFRNNLDTILKHRMVADTMGSQYADDAGKPYICGNRAEYVEVSDPSLRLGLSQQERKEKGELKKKFKNPEYVNDELFKLAERLQRDYGVPNNFKTYYNNAKKITEVSKKSASAKATGAKIKNSAEVVEKVKRILEGKPAEEENPDEYLLPMEDDVYYNN